MIKELLAMLKEYILEHVKHRLFFVSLLFLTLFGILVYRLFDLQIRNGEKYQENFTYKSLKTVSIQASRGNIFDCNGKLLAYNESSYNLSYASDTDLSGLAEKKGITTNELRNEIVYKTILILEQNGDDLSVKLPIRLTSSGEMEFTVEGISKNLFLMNVYAVSSVDALTDEQKNATAREVFEYMRGEKFFNVSEAYSDAYALKILSVRYEIWLNRYQQYMVVSIADDVSVESYAAITENADELLGMNVTIESHRIYNDAIYFAHIIGYIGNISNEEMEAYNGELPEEERYDANDMVGKMGLEQVFESELRGTDGFEQMYVDNMGKVLEVVESTDTVAGNDIYLTIDSELQKYCYNALEQEIANILLAHLVNVMDSSDHEDIPITDVYAALFENHVIKLNEMNDADATDLEKTVYNNFTNAKLDTISRLDDILSVSHTPLYNLSEEYQEYMEFICEMLRDNGVYDTGVLASTDTTYTSYINNEISLYEFLRYAISQGAIDITEISAESNYYDTDEIYEVLTAYILKEFENDTDFDKLILRYMILSGEISGAQVIHLLFDQEILDAVTDKDYEAYLNGSISSFTFMYNKIQNLEITPAMLALDPCSGSVVVTDVHTGEIKALVSYPSYDNNRLTNVIDPDYYNQINTDKTIPMYNRATMQRTAPGSTFKMISAIAGMEESVIDTSTLIRDVGVFDKTETSANCWIYPAGAHGQLNVVGAIENSCNYFFYEVGYRLGEGGTATAFSDSAGVDALTKYASLFGLDTTSGIELPESEPRISTSDAIRSAIGQSTHNFTATQLSRYVTTIANGGTCYDLSLVSHIQDINGNIVYDNPHTVYNTLDIPASEWNAVKQGMRQVVSLHTSRSALINQIDVNVAGKTGTAQEDRTRPNHALFVSFAPYENPEVSVTCRIPNGYSSGNAEELAGFIYAYMYDPDKLVDAAITGDNQLSD